MDPETVERLRVAKGFRYQSDLARAAGVAQGTVSTMERHSGPYELATVERVARALGVEIDALLLPHEEEVTDDDAGIALSAVLGAIGRPLNSAERRKVGKALMRAGKSLLEGHGGEGTVNRATDNRTGAQLSASHNRRRAVAAGGV